MAKDSRTLADAFLGKISAESMLTGSLFLAIIRLLQEPSYFWEYALLIIILIIGYIGIWYIKSANNDLVAGLRGSFVTMTKALTLADKNGNDYLVAYDEMKTRYKKLLEEQIVIRKAFYCDKCAKSKILDVCECD